MSARRGAALPALVATIGAVGALLFAATLYQGVAAETEAVERSLLEVRGYWASMGQINYALSRARTDGLCRWVEEDDDEDNNPGSRCDVSRDTDRLPILQNYLTEIVFWQSFVSVPGYQPVTIYATASPAVDPDYTNRHSNSGRLRLTGGITDWLSSPAAIRSALRDQRPIAVSFCIGLPDDTSCRYANEALADARSGLLRITNVRRLEP